MINSMKTLVQRVLQTHKEKKEKRSNENGVNQLPNGEFDDGNGIHFSSL